MKKMMKDFILRGFMAAGFGPIVYAIVILIIELCGVDTMQNGVVIFKAIISTYIMAFICAGASTLWQNEKLGLGFQALIHGSLLYLVYLLTYLLNGWIKTESLWLFSIIFIGSYVIIWLIILITEKIKANKLNKQLNK